MTLKTQFDGQGNKAAAGGPGHECCPVRAPFRPRKSQLAAGGYAGGDGRSRRIASDGSRTGASS